MTTPPGPPPPPHDPWGNPPTQPTTQPTAQPTAQPLGPPPGAPPTVAGPVLPPPPSGGTPGLTTIDVDWRRILTGNWLGSALVALATLLTAGTLGMTVALLVKPPDLGVSRTLDLATAFATATFGADFTVSGEIDDQAVSGSFGTFPLTLTLVVLAVAALLFRRMIRDYPSPAPALGDAVRVAVFVGLGLMVPAIAFRGDNRELGRGWGADLSEDEVGERFDYGASIAGSLLLGFLLTLTVLGLVVLARRDWRSPRVQQVLDRVSAVLYGYRTIVVLLPLVGVIGFLLLGFGEESLDEVEDETNLRELITLLVTFVTNGGVWLLALGSGARIGGRGEADGDSDSEYQRLWGDITDDEPGLWASPVVLLLVLVLSAVVVVRRSRDRRHVLGNLLLWAVGFGALVPWLVRLASGHAAGQYEEITGEETELSGVFGPEGVDSTFFLLGLAIVVALAVAAVTGNLRADQLGGLRRLQQVPGPPPPGHAPPTYAPPGQAPPTYAAGGAPTLPPGPDGRSPFERPPG